MNLQVYTLNAPSAIWARLSVDGNGGITEVKTGGTAANLQVLEVEP